MSRYAGTYLNYERVNEVMKKETHDENDLGELFLFLTQENNKLKKEASIIITRVMTNISPAALRQINTYFKNKTSMEWTFNWKNYDISKLTKNIKNKAEIINILGLASFHCNGYFREQAIDKLAKAKEESVFPFILLRTNDYVEIIRIKAKKALSDLLIRDNFKEIVKSYSIIERARTWKHSVYEFVREELSEIERQLAVADILAALETADLKGKIYCYEFLIRQKKMVNEEACNLLLREADPYVKAYTFNHLIEKLSNTELIKSKDAIYNVKNSGIRIKLIEKLFAIDYFTTQEALLFTLTDRYAKVRNAGLEHIKSIGECDEIRYYHELLKENPQNQYAISGICEYGTKEEDEFLKTYLNSKSVKITADVIRFIVKNKFDEYIGVLTGYITDSRISLSNLSRKLLISNKQLVNLDEIYEIYIVADIWHVKENCMLFLRSLAKWESIPYILEFVYSENSDISKRGAMYFDAWKINFNKSFTRPNANQIEKIEKIIIEILKKHTKNLLPLEYIIFILKSYSNYTA